MYQSGTPLARHLTSSHSGCKPLPLPDRFHDRKGRSFLQSLAAIQIDHDIVTGADGRLESLPCPPGSGSGHFPATRPFHGTVPDDPHQDQKNICGFVSSKHLHSKIRSELRNTQRSQLTAADVLGCDAQGLRYPETGDMTSLSVQRDILYRIQSDQILEHTDHRRIIMSEDIKL